MKTNTIWRQFWQQQGGFVLMKSETFNEGIEVCQEGPPALKFFMWGEVSRKVKINWYLNIIFSVICLSFQAEERVFLESWKCASFHVSILIEFVLKHLSTELAGGLFWLHVNTNVLPQVAFLDASCLSTHLARPNTSHFLHRTLLVFFSEFCIIWCWRSFQRFSCLNPESLLQLWSYFFKACALFSTDLPVLIYCASFFLQTTLLLMNKLFIGGETFEAKVICNEEKVLEFLLKDRSLPAVEKVKNGHHLRFLQTARHDHKGLSTAISSKDPLEELAARSKNQSVSFHLVIFTGQGDITELLDIPDVCKVFKIFWLNSVFSKQSVSEPVMVLPTRCEILIQSGSWSCWFQNKPNNLLFPLKAFCVAQYWDHFSSERTLVVTIFQNCQFGCDHYGRLMTLHWFTLTTALLMWLHCIHTCLHWYNYLFYI